MLNWKISERIANSSKGTQLYDKFQIFETYDNHLDNYDTIGKSKGFGNVGGKKLEFNLPVWTANHDLKNELFCYHATALQKNSHMRLEK